jgi:hypothetical protein
MSEQKKAIIIGAGFGGLKPYLFCWPVTAGT